MSRRLLTTAEFIERSRKVHGSKYGYDRVQYARSGNNVEVVCPTHGSFYQTPSNHMKGQGCPQCGGRYKYDNESFIQKAIGVHGTKYSYERVEYTLNKNPVEIVCHTHGIFRQTPSSHWSGRGCPSCSWKSGGDKNRKTKDEFVASARTVHGLKYSYDSVEYVGSLSPVIIVCSLHGAFSQRPSDHLKGQGCSKCGASHAASIRRSNIEKFIAKAIKVHGDKYSYASAVYINSKTKTEIICPKHGSFLQEPTSHLAGSGCPSCKADVTSTTHRLTQEEFLTKAKAIHGDHYCYSSVEYAGYYREISIICPIHGAYLQKPAKHLSGHGCWQCRESKGQRAIRSHLDSAGLEYVTEATFPSLRYKYPLKFDFLLLKLRTLIEFDGEQHFLPIKHFGGVDRLKYRQILDETKNKWASMNGYHLIRIRHDDNIIAVLERGLKRARRSQTTTPLLFSAA